MARKTVKNSADAVVAAPAKKSRPAAIKATKKDARNMTEAFETLKTKAAQAGEKVTGFAKEAYAFNKANVEAYAEAGKVAVAGAQTAAKEAATVTRSNWDANVAHGKALAGVKSPTDFIKLQGDFARAQFEAASAQMTKSTEFSLKLFGDVMKPLQARYAAASDQIKARYAA